MKGLFRNPPYGFRKSYPTSWSFPSFHLNLCRRQKKSEAICRQFLSCSIKLCYSKKIHQYEGIKCCWVFEITYNGKVVKFLSSTNKFKINLKLFKLFLHLKISCFRLFGELSLQFFFYFRNIYFVQVNTIWCTHNFRIHT